MGLLKWSDGINIDTSGELRAMCMSDGWYVVGKGMLIPVKDKAEADELITQMKGSK